MNREIKFRVWDSNYMSSPFTLQDIQNDRIKFTSECTVMQYTGLKDKNGKEVYEGDIINAKGTVVTVKWYESDLTYLIWHKDHQEWYSLSFLKGLKDFEAIGNIHENPELIESNKMQ